MSDSPLTTGLLLQCLTPELFLQVEVVNTSLQPVEGGSLIVRTFIVNHQGTHVGSPATYKLPELAAGSVAIVAEQSFKGPSDGVAFVFLWLQYASGQLISRNVYWLPDRQVRALLRSPLCKQAEG